jgi:transcriptional regulator with XRE-family HTH domain
MPYYRDKILLKKFGENLRELRTSKKFTQEELAFEADLDITQVGRIERGTVNTSLCVMQRIAKALNVSISKLTDF